MSDTRLSFLSQFVLQKWKAGIAIMGIERRSLRPPTAWSKDNRRSVRFTFRWFSREHCWLVRRGEGGYLRSRFLLMWRHCHGRVLTVTTFEISSFLGTVAKRHRKYLSSGFSRCNKTEKREKLYANLNLEEILAKWMENNQSGTDEKLSIFLHSQIINKDNK